MIARNIPCHTVNTKTKKLEVIKDENENCPKIEEFTEIPLKNQENGVMNGHKTEIDKIPPPTFITDHSATRLREDMELNRKLLEEQNKMKRSILKDAISKYKEKTQAEAKKLEEIKMELETIDSEVSHDISILRKQIESATLNFNNVERHYDSIEKAFLKAKQDLYQAHERKEMLTEHLYRIIEHNEDRKAKKLSELMEKVGLKMSDEATSPASAISN